MKEQKMTEKQAEKFSSQQSNVQLNKFGYYELVNKPTPEELSDYYAKKYYQQMIRTHKASYSDEEHTFRRNKLEQKLRVINTLYKEKKSSQLNFLDVGTGEGFPLDFFSGHGWKVTGLDYSAHGCQTHHPQYMEHLLTGDIQKSVDMLASQGCRYDLILLDNVLEHLLDPARLLCSLAPLMADDAVLIIEVPNDFSPFQRVLLETGKIDRPFWVVEPDHISYFNRDGLARLLESCGFLERNVVADFPIDLFLFNENTNYVQNNDRGKSCHAARVELENLFHEISPDATIKMYEVMAELGVGRQITGYYQVVSKNNSRK